MHERGTVHERGIAHEWSRIAGWEYFVLSIPAADLADTVLKIGGAQGIGYRN